MPTTTMTMTTTHTNNPSTMAALKRQLQVAIRAEQYNRAAMLQEQLHHLEHHDG